MQILFLLVFSCALHRKVFGNECGKLFSCEKDSQVQSLSKQKLETLKECLKYDKDQIPVAKEEDTQNTVWFHFGEPTILDLDVIKQVI